MVPQSEQVPIQARKINTRFLAIESLQQLVEPQDSVQQIHCIHTDWGTRTARVVKNVVRELLRIEEES